MVKNFGYSQCLRDQPRATAYFVIPPIPHGHNCSSTPLPARRDHTNPMPTTRLANLDISGALPEWCEYVLMASVDCALKTVADMQLYFSDAAVLTRLQSCGADTRSTYAGLQTSVTVTVQAIYHASSSGSQEGRQPVTLASILQMVTSSP
ncbi:hypothetical protein BJV78DRAFT_90341 [Lactifluus subvellereus]|nr:hypothetical protein BJV78DRAFT_90341 [Lactifluus subvellereus]